MLIVLEFNYFQDIVLDLALHFLDKEIGNFLDILLVIDVHVFGQQQLKLVGISAFFLVNLVVFVVLKNW